MSVPPRLWRIPAKLPPCWWVAVQMRKGSITWYGPYDTKKKAQTGWIHTWVKDWPEKPVRLDVVMEDPKSFQSKVMMDGDSHAKVTARWNWFRRHRKTLTSWAKPKACQLLIPSQRQLSKDLLSHRLGGPAVLPDGHPWPTFRLEEWSGKRIRTYCVLGTFIATLDLRNSSAHGKGFPDAISLFLCTYCDFQKCYLDSGASQSEGIVIPLSARDRLTAVPVPVAGCQLAPLAVDAWEVPDFPPITDVIGNSTGLEEAALTCNAIGEREPGTGDWAHLPGLKIGGYESYLQHNLRERMQADFPGLEWHYIATWQDARVGLGDSGEMYIVAGLDRAAKAWRWHCQWECF